MNRGQQSLGIQQEFQRVQLKDSDTCALRLKEMGITLAPARLEAYTVKQDRVKQILN